jgi:diacylglycerol kinase family enzyme
MAAPNVLVIVNPVAGRGRGAGLGQRLAECLRTEGCDVEILATRARGDARERAAQVAGNLTAIVSVGGDGTLSEVLSGLRQRAIPVAQLALGTANVLAMDLRLPREPTQIARVVLAGRVQRVDLARVGQRLCFLGASAGYDARVVHALERLRRGPITKFTWARAALAEFRDYAPPQLSVEVDGQLEPGTFGMVLIANVVNYAGWPSLAADRVLDDGRFEAYLFPARSRLDLLRHAARGVFARFPGGGVRRVSGRRFRVACAEPVALQVDGDAAGHAPFELTVEAEPCRILVP